MAEYGGHCTDEQPKRILSIFYMVAALRMSESVQVFVLYPYYAYVQRAHRPTLCCYASFFLLKRTIMLYRQVKVNNM